MYNRNFILNCIDFSQSLFLLAPRQTGKTSFLRKAFPHALYIDLLNSVQFQTLGNNPSELVARVDAFRSLDAKKQELRVVIDEIQKIPSLLDAVHECMNRFPEVIFVMTGSSARKLKKSGVNLLGGRAHWVNFHGITSQDVPTWKNQTWKDIVQFGGLPRIVGTERTKATRMWSSYVDLYLKEEIMQEALVRNIPLFSRFLRIAGLTSGQQIVFEKIGSDNEIQSKTVRAWYDVLSDTLVGCMLECFSMTTKRKAVASPKFYFFDVGVAYYLKNQSFPLEGTASWGEALEHFLFCELKAYLDLFQRQSKLYYWRTQSGTEVDFIIACSGKPSVSIEVKSKAQPLKKDFSGILAFQEEFKESMGIVVCQTPNISTHENGIWLYPVEDFLKALWAKAFVIP